MKNWKSFTVLAITAVLLLSSCWTTKGVATVYGGAPEVRENEIGESIFVYIVRTKNEYYNEKAIKYAINEFVKSKGHESYDMELIRRPGFARLYFEYSITVPGSIIVEDLPVVRVIDEVIGF